MERFRQVLEKNPRRGTAFDRVYGAYVERGEIAKLVAEYAARTAADPKDGVSWMVLGLIESQRGRDAAAVEAFAKAEQVLADNPQASFYLGQSLVLVGKSDEAVAAFERAIARKPAPTDLLEVFQALGRVHQRTLQKDKALAIWDRLERQFPNDPRVQEQIAQALLDEGQMELALPRFEKLATLARISTNRLDIGSRPPRSNRDWGKRTPLSRNSRRSSPNSIRTTGCTATFANASKRFSCGLTIRRD